VAGKVKRGRHRRAKRALLITQWKTGGKRRERGKMRDKKKVHETAHESLNRQKRRMHARKIGKCLGPGTKISEQRGSLLASGRPRGGG